MNDTQNFKINQLKSSILLSVILFCFGQMSFAQSDLAPDFNPNIEQAKYTGEDVNQILQKDISYPVAALRNKTKGDVIVSFEIDAMGKLNHLKVESSPDLSLSTSTVIAINNLEGDWIPCRMNGQAVTKNYKMLFRYRFYLDASPPAYKTNAEKFFEKQKYEKALQQYNKAIKDNPHDYALFESRSKPKEILNDTEGSKADILEANRLKNEFLAVVDILAIGETSRTEIEKRIERY